MKEQIKNKIVSRLVLSTDSIAFVWFLVGLTLLPIFVIPFAGIPASVAKQLFLPMLVLGAFIFWLVGRIEARDFKLAKSLSLVAVALPVLATLGASLLSGNVHSSLSGVSYDFGTFISILSLAGVFFLTSIFLTTKEKALNVYLALLSAGLLASLYQLIQFVLGTPDRFWWFTFVPTLIGKWYESAIFFGFITFLSLMLLEFLSLKEIKLFKIFLTTSLVLSLILVGLVNFYAVWIALAILSLGVFVYANLWSGKNNIKSAESNLSSPVKLGGLSIFRPSFIVLLLSILFLTLATPTGLLTEKIAKTYTFFKVPFVEVRPGWQATLSIAKEVAKEDVIFGVGPNRFYTAWINHKPAEINLTQFWNIDFNSGVGTLPTLVVNSGLIGLLAWIIFFGVLLVASGRLLVASYRSADKLGHIMAISSVVGALYFWIFSFVYVTETVPMVLAFVFSGLVVALSVQTGLTQVFDLQAVKNKKHQMAVVGAMIVILVISVSCFYLVFVRSVGTISFYRAVREANVVGNITKAEDLLARAIKYNGKSDLYYRTLSNVQFVRLAQLLRDPNQDKEQLQDQFRIILQTTIANSNKAIELDQTSYLNHVSLGQIYESLVPLKVEGAYEQALAEYTKAKKLNPSNPSISFNFARLEMTGGNNTGARNYLSQSLTQKPNFASALLVLAQIEAQGGDLPAAIKNTEEAAVAYPNDPSAFFQLGFYLYQNGDYAKAVPALNRVVLLSPNNVNANAQYFLGLAYDRLGDKTNALKQFEQIAQYNPDNQEVKNIISNLKAGRNALEAAVVEAPKKKN
jgi:tetratricopeptide (TPR) repeat protein